MDYRFHRRPRSCRLAPYRHALDHIEAFLDATGYEDERAKMERAMLLLFGPPPVGWDEHGMPLCYDPDHEPGEVSAEAPGESPVQNPKEAF